MKSSGCVYSQCLCVGCTQYPKPTCKLPVAVATVTKPGDELAIELEDEDAAGFVVHHNDVAVPVYRDAFRAHQLPRADLIL